MARDLIYAVVGLVMVAGVCTGCRAQAQVAATGGGAAADATATTKAVMPPQIENWHWGTNGTNIFPGRLMSIKGDVLTFTNAGPFKLEFLKQKNSYQIFKLTAQPTDQTRSFNRLCYKGTAGFIGFHLTRSLGIENNAVDVQIYCLAGDQKATDFTPSAQFFYGSLKSKSP